MQRLELHQLLDHWLSPGNFEDVAHNGLQVEGRAHIEKIVCGVSANAELIERAIQEKADALFVHHGLVWGGGIQTISGWLGKRISRLVNAELNLFAYHLPLDAHPSLGNNAGLAEALGLSEDTRTPFGEYKGQLIGFAGLLESTVSFETFCSRVEKKIGPILFAHGDPQREIQKVSICSGGAPDRLYEAVDSGADLFLTGEATEWVQAISKETGVAFIAAGHHATERFGPRKVASALCQETSIDAQFIDVPNPL